VGSVLCGVYSGVLQLTEEMDFVSPCIIFILGRMMMIGLLLVRCLALLLIWVWQVCCRKMLVSWLHSLTRDDCVQLGSLLGVDGMEDLDQFCKCLKEKWKEIESFMPTEWSQGKGIETMEQEVKWDSNVASTIGGALGHIGK
jgi:hypothetical protein